MPVVKHKSPFGGDAGFCPQVHSAFDLKELQQYRYYILIKFLRQPWVWYAILPIRTQTFVLDLR